MRFGGFPRKEVFRLEREGAHAPDFFIIGAPKSRTTWLAHCLDDHPDVSLSRIKEPNHFVPRWGVFQVEENRGFLADWDWYLSLWDDAPEGNVLGEASVNLLPNGEASAQAVKEHYPEARIIACLRDPVSRAHSDYWNVWGRRRHWGGVPDSFEEAIEDESLLRRSRYAETLEPWLERFERTHVVTDFEMDEHPLRVVQDVYRFLGVDSDFRPPSLDVRLNAAKARRGFFEAGIGIARRLRDAGLGDAVDAVKRLGLHRVIHRFDFEPLKKPPLDPRVAARLRARLLPDIKRLERLLDRDLSPWKEPDKRQRPTLPPRADQRIRQMRHGSRPAPAQR